MSSANSRVSSGGLFHSRKVEYSPETQAFLKELIRESKLSMFQRRKLEESVSKGDPLPLPPSKTGRRCCSGRKDPKREIEENVKFYECPRRRKEDSIKESGAYEREKFVPNYSTRNHDTEKKRLQDFMAFGKTIKEDKSKALARLKAKEKIKDEIDLVIEKDQIYTETLKEIKERLDFLSFMEEKGQKGDYDHIIKQEIAAKMRTLEEMDQGFRTEQRKEYQQIRERAAFKIFGNLSK